MVHTEHFWHEIGELGHLASIHFPIALYFLELALILFWFARNDEAYRRFALFSFRFSYLIMLGALVTGFLAAGGFEGIVGPVRSHFIAAASVFIFYSGRGLYWRFAKKGQTYYKSAHLILAFTGYGLVLLTAFLGGKLGHG